MSNPSPSLIVKTYTFLRSFFVVAGWTSVSRLSGVVREIIFANIFGASAFSDIYAISIKLPNFFRRFFAEGALNAVLVPRFANLLTHQPQEEVYKFAHRMLAVLATGLVFFVVLFELIMPGVIHVIAPGFRNNAYMYTNVVYFARWMFPYIWLISMVALMSGYLNSMHYFAWPAAISIVANLSMITALLIGKLCGAHVPLRGIMHLLSWSVLVGGVLQCCILWKECGKHGLKLKWVCPTLSPEIRQLLKASIPGMIGASVMQINVFVDMAFGSLLPVGSVSYLNYADRLNQFPISLLGAAIGTTLLPGLSRYWHDNKIEEAYSTQNRAILFGFALVLPAAIGLFVLAQPLVDLLYGHGKFDSFAVSQTMLALKAFVFGLPAYVFTKVATSIFFANKDTKTPVIIAAVCVLINGTLNYILKDYFAHVGIAMATAIASTLNAILGFTVLYRRKMIAFKMRQVMCVVKILIAGFAMGFSLHYMHSLLAFHYKIGVLLTVLLGACIYTIVALLLRIQKDFIQK